MNLRAIFVEEGESAKTDARPQLARMLQFCKASDTVDILIVPKIDRLARNAFDYAKIKLALESCGVKIESVGERIEDSPVGRFTETILASAAQFENEVRAERSKGGMIEAVSTGRWVWRAPRGYRNVRVDGKGTIEPRPDEADLIVEAFRRLATGTYSPTDVHRWLQEQGFALTRSAFYRLIRNPVYIGEMHVFDDVFHAVDPFVQLVSRGTFERARLALATSARPTRHARLRDDFPLKGVLFCVCGQQLTACWSRGRNRSYAYYRCMKCQGVNISVESVHSELELVLARFRANPGVWERIQNLLLEWERGREERAKQSVAILRQEISSRESLIRSIALKNAGGIIPDDVAKDEIARLTGEIGAIQAQQPQGSSNAPVQSILDFAQEFLQDMRETWLKVSSNKKRQLLDYLFPAGLTYEKGTGFRTTECEPLELLSSPSSGKLFRLVDPNCELSNQLFNWLSGFVEILSEPRDLIKNSD